MEKKGMATFLTGGFVGLVRNLASRGYWGAQRLRLSTPKHIRCNICGWQGCRFADDSWHQEVICPACRSDVRQRLLRAALELLPRFSVQRLFFHRRVLHFAPERSLRPLFAKWSGQYVTADICRQDCDIVVDMNRMDNVSADSIDTLVALDVLEHVRNFEAAVTEVMRVLVPGGTAIITVPQREDLEHTDEDLGVVLPAERRKRYGVADHLRIFGRDFPDVLSSFGFRLDTVEKSDFENSVVAMHGLAPKCPSNNPLATNERRIFFATKAADVDEVS